MIPELGHFALILALLLAALLGTLPLVGAQRAHPRVDGARAAARAGQFLFVAFAFVCLAYSFVANDFSVLNVATNSNSQLPLHYRFAAAWGSHEGSMLLWMLMLAVWTLAVALLSRHLPDEMVARVLGVMGLVAVGFLLFMLLTSNPFERLFPAAADGRDLNPLLQDPGMVIHPPMLYMGYVGFSVAFAFAIAALIGGRLDATWARWSRPWTTLAWCFLTLRHRARQLVGVLRAGLGRLVVLGSGRERVVHAVARRHRADPLARGHRKARHVQGWTVLLAICAFSLSLLGTFLVRSGVLTSVHAFATDPRRGVFILAFLVIVIGGSLALFALRAPKVGGGGRFDLVSRETMLLANNVLLIVAAGSVLLGTLYPLFLDALNLGKISVGPPYFDTVFVPLMAPLVFLMGVGPLARWKQAPLPELWQRLRWALAVQRRRRAACCRSPPAIGRRMASFGLLLAVWIVAATVVIVRERVPRRARQACCRAARAPAAQLLGHDGRAPRRRRLHHRRDAGQGLRDRARRPDGTSATRSPSAATRSASTATTERAGPELPRRARQLRREPQRRARRSTLYPREAHLPRQRQPMTEAAIDDGVTRDLYVSLGEPVDGGAWSVRVYSQAVRHWIWGGCLLMALGGLLALSDRRYRAATQRATQRVPARRRARGLGARAHEQEAADPARVFVVLVRVPARRPVARPARGALAADRQAGAAFTLAQLHEPAKTLGPEDMKGKVWLLNVWASWCVSCREEHPLLVELAQAKIVPIVGLNYKDEPADGQALARRRTATLRRLGRRPRRPGRHRLRRLRRARDLRHRQAGRRSATSRSARSPRKRSRRRSCRSCASCRNHEATSRCCCSLASSRFAPLRCRSRPTRCRPRRIPVAAARA